MFSRAIIHGDSALTYKIGEFLFIWFGGAYIDILQKTPYWQISIEGEGYSYTDMNINVWDYDTNRPMIDRGNVVNFIATCEEWAETV